MDNKTNSSKKDEPLSVDRLIGEVRYLISQPGYIYSLMVLVHKDRHLGIDEYKDQNWMDNISFKELNFLLGFFVQNKYDLSVKPSEELFVAYMQTTKELLELIHRYFGEAMAQETFGKYSSLDELKDVEFKDLFGKNSFFEAYFYGESGAYDFQYLDVIPRRYKKDNEYVKEKFGFNIDNLVKFGKELKEVLHKKINSQSQLMIASAMESNFDDYLNAAFDMFVFSIDEITSVPKEEALSIIDLYTSSSSSNLAYQKLDDFNEFEAKPLIQIEVNKSYLCLSSFQVFKAMDELLFYEFGKDDKYYPIAMENRGEFLELEIERLMKKIFGEKRVLRNVNILRSKSEVLTDADVLVLIGNKAIVFQAKSKKMTHLARNGNLEKIKNDFEGAIQKAYEQGQEVKSALLNNDYYKLLDKEGNEIILEDGEIDDVYIYCVTNDEYPNILFQSQLFLKKEEGENSPLCCSLYDLDLLCRYLEGPYDFLFYTKQRIKYSEQLASQGEIDILAFHLQSKLCFAGNEVEMLTIDSSMGQLIDDDILKRQAGLESNFPEIISKNGWKTRELIQITTLLDNMKIAGFTDAILTLYELSPESIKKLFKDIEKTKQRATVNGQTTLRLSFEKGKLCICFVSIDSTNKQKLVSTTKEYFHNARQRQQADEIIVFSSFAKSKNPIEVIFYTKEKFVKSPKSEAFIDYLKATKKIGRNEPCPCGSGKKYKKCCLLK